MMIIIDLLVTYILRRKKVVWIQWLWSWDKTRRELSIRRRVDWRRRERQWSWLEVISKLKSKGIIIPVHVIVVGKKKVSETERHAQLKNYGMKKVSCWCCFVVGFEIGERREREWSILCMIREACTHTHITHVFGRSCFWLSMEVDLWP